MQALLCQKMHSQLNSRLQHSSILNIPILYAEQVSLAMLAYAGNPMAWYSSPPLAYCIYLPMALAAAAVPYALTQTPHSPAPPQTRPLQAALLGYALVISAVAGLSVALGMGSGYLFAAWGVCALLAAGLVTLVSLC